MRWAPSIVVLGLLALPARASACRRLPLAPAPSTDGTLEDPFVITALTVTALDAALVVGDAAVGADRRLLPEGAAWLQLAWGLTHVVGGAALTMTSALVPGSTCFEDERRGLFLGAAASLVTLGGWFLGHAIWSLRAEAQPDVQPTLSVWHEGGMLGLRGVY